MRDLRLPIQILIAAAILIGVAPAFPEQEVLLSSKQGSGRHYCVDSNHPKANDHNPGTPDRPWKTIARANQVLKPGDTVHIKAGRYTDFIEPAVSGTAQARITYTNFKNDKPVITEAARGISLRDRSYVTVQGIHFRKLDEFLWLTNASNNVIAHCTFEGMRRRNWSGSKIYRTSQYNWVHHCTFSRWGYYTRDDHGCVLDLGNESDRNDFTKFNLIEDNTMYHGGHHIFGIYGSFNVIRNNYFHNENWSDDWGNRNLSLNGHDRSSGRNLIEGNRIAFSGFPPDNVGASGMSLATRHNIVRFNCFYGNNSAGLMLSVTQAYPNSPCYNKVYNNTFYRNGYISEKHTVGRYRRRGPGSEQQCGLGLAFYNGRRRVIGNVIKNNLFFGNPKPYGTYRVNLAEQTIAGNWEEAGNPRFVNVRSALKPSESDLPDLHLRRGSPCINRGVFLTRVTSRSGSGKVFQVEEAGYFMDGWGIIKGDEIQLARSKKRVRITKIDYSSNTITVEGDLTWTRNRGIGLAYEGSAPDMGAYEFVPAPSQKWAITTPKPK